jgi:hypothetical protein
MRAFYAFFYINILHINNDCTAKKRKKPIMSHSNRTYLVMLGELDLNVEAAV